MIIRNFGELIRKQDWGGFMLNILSVIIGIGITFAGEDYLTHRKEQKEV